jgi:hypothetical protein
VERNLDETNPSLTHNGCQKSRSQEPRMRRQDSGGKKDRERLEPAQEKKHWGID